MRHDAVIVVLCGVSRGAVCNLRTTVKLHGSAFASLGQDHKRPKGTLAPADVLQTVLAQDEQMPCPTIEEDMGLPELQADGCESADGDADGAGPAWVSKLEEWRKHPNFLMGIRRAEIATQW